MPFTKSYRLVDPTLFWRRSVEGFFLRMNRWKFPRSNGMPALFHQKFWDIIGSDVTKAVLESLHSGRLLSQISFTFIYLIPKVASPKSFSQFHPISLCNVIYKCFYKYLSNQLKKVMSLLIGPYRNVFVPGRLTGDSCLMVASSCNH